jgi:hypothetical protein
MCYCRRNLVGSLPRGIPAVVDESARRVRDELDVTQNRSLTLLAYIAFCVTSSSSSTLLADSSTTTGIPPLQTGISSHGVVGAAGKTAPTNPCEPSLKSLSVVVYPRSRAGLVSVDRPTHRGAFDAPHQHGGDGLGGG